VKKTLKRYLPFIKEYKLQYFLVFVGILLTVSATAGTAYIMQPMMDEMFIKQKKEYMYIIPIALIVLYIIKSLGRYLQSVMMGYIGTHIISRFRQMLLEKIISLDMAFLYVNKSGELISRITNDVQRVQYFVSNLLADFVREGLSVIALIGYVLYLNYHLAFYAFVVVPLVVYPLFYVAKKLKKYSHRSQEKNADVVFALTEIFNNVEMIKASATEEKEIEHFEEENWKFFKINMKSIYVGEIVSPFLEISGAIGIALIIYIGGNEVYEGRMSTGEFIAFLTAVGLVFKPIKLLGQIYSKIQDAIAASERIFEILDTQSKIKDGHKELQKIEKIEYKDVVLEYEGYNLLDRVNCTISQGEHVALVGESGGGKSTFIQMLLRYYDPKSGAIYINDEDIKSYTLASLKSKIAFVTQRVYIVSGTVASNVAYGVEKIDKERVIEALKVANALEFVTELGGIDAILEEGGSNLSGGQRQRIAIARAVYKEAELYLFDEATAALDNESEALIQAALKHLTKEKITITVAHRLSTIQDADRIFVFIQGKIVCQGRYEELLKNCPHFQRLAGELAN